REQLAFGAASRERGIGALDDERNVAAHERERLVSAKDAREQARFAEDLKAVADPEDEPTVRRELGDRRHRRRKACDRAAAQVVTVREPTREHDGVEVRQLGLGMPDEDGLRVERGESPERVTIVAGSRKAEDADARLRARQPSSSASSIS